MALVQAQRGIDSLSVDFNFYSRHFYDDEFADNTNFRYGGRSYEDAYLINGYDGSADLVLLFLGYDIGFDSSGRANRGTVTALAEGTYSGQDIWCIQDISVPSSRLNSVAATYSNADDRALIASVLSGDDTIQLSAYDDRFEAWGGNDRILGGAGNDTLFGGDGNDTIQGGAGADSIFGNAGNDHIVGGSGNDTLNGGAGNDVYLTDSGDTIVEAANAGLDWVSSSANHSLAANVENLTLTGSASHGTGNALNNLIRGNAGANVLNGGAGNDTLQGGGSNDIYYTDGNDTIVEAANAGLDWISSSANHSLAANVENLTLTGSATNGTGNALNNLIRGNAGANVLNGAAGNDTLEGGTGHDVYYTNGSDTIIDGVNGGVDRVISSVSYVLGVTLENLVLSGTAAINGTGNTSVNAIWGNAAANSIVTGRGNDFLIGGAGADTLNGGAGIDRAQYDNAAAGVVVDLVYGSQNTGDAAGDVLAEIENLLGSSFDDTLVGDARANTLWGDRGNDVLSGRGGADVLIGGLGSDTFFFREGFGADAAVDFQDNIDTLRILDFGITSFAQARTHATQAGSDVVFNFGNGDLLTVRNSTINALANDMVFV